MITFLFLLFSSTNVCLGLIGGNPAPNYPFFVGVEQNGVYCGGTIVASNAIITAARCLVDPETRRLVRPNAITVVKYVEDEFEILYSCEKYIYHNNFQHPTAANGFQSTDIAVLKMKECFAFENSQNAQLLPCPVEVDFREAYAVGFDRRASTAYGRPLGNLEEVKLYRHVCKNFGRDLAPRGQEVDNLCFGSNATLAQDGVIIGITKYDYGGPLVFKVWDQSRASCLYGIASAQVPKSKGFPITSVFTRASTFNLFIRKSLESFAQSATASCTVMK